MKNGGPTFKPLRPTNQAPPPPWPPKTTNQAHRPTEPPGNIFQSCLPPMVPDPRPHAPNQAPSLPNQAPGPAPTKLPGPPPNPPPHKRQHTNTMKSHCKYDIRGSCFHTKYFIRRSVLAPRFNDFIDFFRQSRSARIKYGVAVSGVNILYEGRNIIVNILYTGGVLAPVYKIHG